MNITPLLEAYHRLRHARRYLAENYVLECTRVEMIANLEARKTLLNLQIGLYGDIRRELATALATPPRHLNG